MARKRVQRLEVHPEHPAPHRIRQAAAALESGNVILYPTDGIYGLGADILQRAATDRLYTLRRLNRQKPLSLVCSSLAQASEFTIISDECFRFMRRHFPGPYTMVLRAMRAVPRLGHGKRKTVGIRIPAHPVSRALIEQLGRPLVSTSAIVDEIESELSDPRLLVDHFHGDQVSLCLDSGLLPGTPSTVIDWSSDTPEILRMGAGEVSELLDAGIQAS